MAEVEFNSVHDLSSNQYLRQLSLFSLISQLCPPRQSRPDAGLCRLILDSRLHWAIEPIDGNTSWLYLPQAAHVKKLAGCLVLTAD
jgi:hypothetical protein